MTPYADVPWERMIRGVAKVRERLTQAAAALAAAGVPYSVFGDNAVAAWVARVDEAAVRNTKDVDVLLRRSDLEAAKAALSAVGFVFRHVKGIDMFLDGPDAKARDAVHIIFAGEKVRADHAAAAPEISESEAAPTFRLVALEALVRMELTASRLNNQVNLRDMLEVSLIDSSWCDRLPAILADRLRHLIATPEG